MKFLSILAAASLALAPAIASADSHPDSTDDSLTPGGTAVRVIDRSAIPVGAIIIGSLVLIGGVVIAVLSDNGGGGGGSSNSTNFVPAD